MNLTTDKANEYLDLFKVSDDKYIIGVYQPGITIYKQQVRALNIFYSLYITGKIKKDKDFTVGIVGGGIAGLTFATAALQSKIKVHIIEKRDRFLAIQSGCNNRPIHPNAYDWPDPRSRESEADLPVMNWKGGRTSDFCLSIENQYQRVKDSFAEVGPPVDEYLTEGINFEKIDSISYDPLTKLYKIESVDDPNNNLKVSCDLIIYAIGYGVEWCVYKKTPSYWRDIDTHQSKLADEKYLISGLGDGAFMDMFIILIKDFDYDEIFDIIYSDEKSDYLETVLAAIKEAYFERKLKSPDEPDNFLYKQFKSIKSGRYDYIVKKLRERKRDSLVILNGINKFEDSLNLTRISMLNAFIGFLLFEEKNFFSYKQGSLNYNEATKTCTIEGTSEIFSGYVLLLRHGFDTKGNINDIPGLLDEITSSGIEGKQRACNPRGIVNKMWSNKELDRIFEEAHYDQIEKISANALPVFECYTAILTNIIKETLGSKCSPFRIAIHKVIKRSGKTYYQQITPYPQNQSIRLYGGHGKIFSSKEGSVGYTINTTKPSLIVREDSHSPESFEAYLKALNYSHAARKSKILKSIFTIPILAPVVYFDKQENKDVRKAVANLIIYIDSENQNFFNPKLVKAILSTTAGLVDAIETSIRKKHLTMDDIEFIPGPLVGLPDYNRIANDVFFKKNSAFFKNVIKGLHEDYEGKLLFNRFYSFTSTNKTLAN